MSRKCTVRERLLKLRKPVSMIALLMLATALAAAAARSAAPCLGEFELDPSSGECELSSNFNVAADAFDTDEPTASHISCGTAAFRCPGGYCVNTAAAYAACTTGKPAPQPITGTRRAPTPEDAVVRPCNVSGAWECGGVRGVIMVDEALDSFNVSTVDAPKGFAWSTGTGTVAQDGTTVSILYPETSAGFPQRRSGLLSADCSTIAWNDSSVWTCDYNGADLSGTCPVPAPTPAVLDVHIVPHTHDDTGYLSTVDEYYASNVRAILDTVTSELQKNPARRFTYVEMAFFSKWWDEQSDAKREQVRRLVAEGQLDFSQGGWSMPDEGATHYADLYANAQRGMRFIVQEFGSAARPKVGWSVDPFGHSKTYGAMQAQLGLDAYVVGRIDFQEKAARFASQSMETVWRPRGSNDSDILTHVLDPIQFYGYPPGFNFEGDSRTWITDQNIEQRAKDFQVFIQQKATGYATPSLMVPFGSDFQYTNATINYENLDRLMAHINADQQKYGMRLRYSTPALYVKTLHATISRFPLKTDDFESYAIGPDQFLVGFYSSRPDYKGMIRVLSSQLRSTNAALVLLRLSNARASLNTTDEIQQLDRQERALGVAQHHDAITSSQRRHVHRDYIAQLSAGQKTVNGVAARTTATLLGKGSRTHVPALSACEYLNESTCPITSTVNDSTHGNESVATLVVGTNPLAYTRKSAHIRVPFDISSGTRDGVRDSSVHRMNDTSIWIVDSDGVSVTSQLLPPWPVAPHQHDWTTFVPPAPTVTFAGELPGLGVANWALHQNVAPSANATAAVPSTVRAHAAGSPLVLENDLLRAEFDPDTAMLASLTRKVGGGTVAGTYDGNDVKVSIRHTLRYYVASNGSTGPYAKQGAQGSGNYVFEPTNSSSFSMQHMPLPAKPIIVTGPVVNEVRHVLQNDVHGNVELVYRLRTHANAEGADALEVVYRVGPLDISDGLGKEVVSHFDTDIASNDTWYCDANGQDMIKRRRDTRSSLWPGGPQYFTQTDPVAGNYFAANTMAALDESTRPAVAQGKVSGRRFNVLLDRSEGCASLGNGQLELMLHRRLTHGCRWGMCEVGDDGTMQKAGLNDTLGAEVMITHWLTVDAGNVEGTRSRNGSDSLARLRTRELNNPPVILFGNLTGYKAEQQSNQHGCDGATTCVGRVAPLADESALPQNLELTTLQLVDDGTAVVLRVTHIFPPHEHSTLSSPASVDIRALFGSGAYAQWATPVEMTAAADVPLASVMRLQWKLQGHSAQIPHVWPALDRKSFERVDEDNIISLRPGETRTFLVKFTDAPLKQDESSTELWLARIAAQKIENFDLGLTDGVGDSFTGFPFKPFSQSYVKKALAEGVDWRTKGVVTPAKSQGSHGVCGTFGQTQTAESQYALGGGGANPAKQPNQLTQFSEQQILSCKCQKVVTPSCGGSTHSDAWIFYGRAPVPGIQSTQSYPFNQSSWPDDSPPPCHFNKTAALPRSVFSNTTSVTYAQSSGDNYGQLEAMIHHNGPMQIGINAGVFKWKVPHGQASGVAHWVNASGCAAAASAGLHSIDHSLGVVGFGTDEKQGDYWILKNSWGSTWGDQGFVYIARGPGLWCGNLFASGAHTYTYGDPKYYYEQ